MISVKKIRFDHINIVVDDIDLMSHFYSNVIGLNVFNKARISGGWADRVVGLKGVEADVVILNGCDGPNIELIRYIAPEGTRQDQLTIPNTKGLRHIAFQVNDIHGVVDACARKGVRFHSEVQEVPTAQIPQEGNLKKRLVYFEDPEGTLLELCSYEP